MTRCRPIHGGGGETVATDSFKFWDSYLEACEDYTDEEFGALVRALAKSVFFGEEPDFGGKSKFLKSTFRVMKAQAEQSRKMAALGRKGGQSSGKSRARKSSGSDASKRNRSALKSASNEKRREEVKGTETSSLREEGAAYAGAGSRPPATPAQDPWDDPDYDGPIPYGEGGDADWS